MVFKGLSKIAFKSPLSAPKPNGTPKTGFLTSKPEARALSIGNVPRDLKARTGAVAQTPFASAIRDFGGGGIRKSVGLSKIRKI